MEEEKKATEELTDEEFAKTLLGEEEEETEEEKKKKDEELRKNKDAEEARKRREAEEKAKKEAEEKAKKEAEEKAKQEAEKAEAEKKVKTEAEEEAKKTQKEKNREELGKQLSEFKKKYPDVDLSMLDNDKHFHSYAKGKILGERSFTEIYEDFIEFKADISKTEKEVLEKNYLKANSSSGSSQGKIQEQAEVFSEEEYKKIVDKMPMMSPKEVEKVWEKYSKSVEYYKNKNKN